MIKLSHINKYYFKGKSNELHVINDTSIELPDKGLISFLGQSGSGKTTLLNVIGGLDKATGEITYDDITFKNYNMKQVDKLRSKNIGYVFQNYNLILEETVYNNLKIALSIIGITDQKEVDARIEYCLKAVGMFKYRKKQAYALSGGQQQRVSIARALLKRAKLIIADEPTGNLDSDNTYAVMNILKKISKNTLVLLVTHSEEIANFYSDQIVRIKDGKIDSIVYPSKENTISLENSKKIYLKDLNQKEEEKVHFYYDKDIPSNLEFKVIIKNGNIYLDSNYPVKLVNDSGIILINDKYKKITKDDLELTYNNQWFNDKKAKFNIIDKIKSYIYSFTNNTLRINYKSKIVFASMLLLGILFAIFTTMITNYAMIDETSLFSDNEYYQFYSDYEDISITKAKIMVNSGIRKGEFIDYVIPIEAALNINKKINYSESINLYIDTYIVKYSDNTNHKIIVGSAPLENQILISKRHANYIISEYDYYFSDYNDLIGLNIGKIFNNNDEFVISGIIDVERNISYINENNYYGYILNKSYYTRMIFRDYNLEKNNYEIMYGRDLNDSDIDTANILLNISLAYSLMNSHNLEKIEDVLELEYSNNDKKYNIVGIFYSNIYTSNENIIINAKMPDIKIQSGYINNYDIIITSGRRPTNYNEFIANVYSSYKLGDVVKDSFGYERKCVGLYNGEYQAFFTATLNTGDYCLLNYNFFSNSVFSNDYSNINCIWFKIKDIEQYNQTHNTEYTKIITSEDYQIKILREERQNTLTTFLIISIVLLFTLAIFSYFFMRSRMLKDIYSIGVYRLLGASRSSIRKKYLKNIFVLSTFTALLSYIITLIIVYTISKSITDMLSYSTILTSWWFNICGGILLYIFMLFFGILPIISLLRKTPSEIISKYDI
ncbi:MAG: ATP-binding cassette domain-containing protein [Anaeroplasma sp.]